MLMQMVSMLMVLMLMVSRLMARLIALMLMVLHDGANCHDRFLPVGRWFKGGLRVEVAASRRG